MLASARCVAIAKELLKPPLSVFLLCFKSAVFSLLENDHLTHSESERHTKTYGFLLRSNNENYDCRMAAAVRIKFYLPAYKTQNDCSHRWFACLTRSRGQSQTTHYDIFCSITSICMSVCSIVGAGATFKYLSGERCHSISRFAFASAPVKCEKCLPYLFMCWKRPASYPLDRSAHLNHRKFSSTTGRYESLIQPTGCFAEISPGFGGNPGLLAPRSLIMSLSHRLCETTLTQHFPRKAQTMFLRSGHDSERPLLN